MTEREHDHRSVERRDPAVEARDGAAPGRGLPADVRGQMERAFGADFSNVEVGEDAAVAAAGARAVAEGDAIRFAPGALSADTDAGRELIGHELAHVVQQRQGRGPSGQASGAFAIDPALEAEADAMGARAARGEQVDVGSVPGSVSRAAPQPKIGFEFELQVVLAQGGFPPTESGPFATKDAPTEDTPFLEVSQLVALPGKPLNASKQRPMVAVRSNHPDSGGKILYFRWNPNLVSAPKGLRPQDLEPSEPGGWEKQPDFTAERATKSTAYVDPCLNKDEVLHREDGLYKAVQDRAQNPFFEDVRSLVELVTEPRDEALEEEAFLEPVTAAMKAAAAIYTATDDLQRRAPASAVFGGARRDLYLGHDGLSSQSKTAAVQATFGVQLAAVPELLASKKEGAGPDLDITVAAGEVARKFLKTIGLDDSPGLAGLFHLVCVYLVAGGTRYQGRGGLDKNQVPLLVRHSISILRPSGLSVPDKQRLREMKPEPAPQLSVMEMLERRDDAPTKTDFLQILLDVTGRHRGEKLFQQMTESPNVATWLEAALWGNDDGMIAWGESLDITPERCGPAPTTGAIIEERHPASTFLPDTFWIAFAKEQRKRFRALNGIDT